MKTVALNEAQTQLSGLLDEVANGERIIITRQGKPAAMIVPPPKEEQSKPEVDVRQVVKEMLEYRDRQKRTLGGLTFRQMIEEGRRY